MLRWVHCVFGSLKGFRPCLPPKAASETLPVRSQRENSAVVRELSWWTRSAVLGPRFHFKSFSSSIRSPSGQYPRSSSFLSLPPVIQNRIALFADDSKCHFGSSVNESLQDCESFQKDLDSLHGWSDNWHLKFYTSKCEVLTVTRKLHSFRYDYKLNNNSIKNVTQAQDLGVTISPDLAYMGRSH